jgi:hypothetical protein
LRPSPSPRCTPRRRPLRAAASAFLGALALLVLGPAAARAETVFTGQATAAHATANPWMTWPGTPPAVCIVDSGVNVTPDTAPALAARFAYDGSALVDDVDPGRHGTLMAMIAAARKNGWGMVGAAPVRVVSVRAQRPGEDTIYFDDWRAGVQVCRNLASAYNIKVISLSLGSQGRLDDVSQARMQSTIDFAIASGLNVVAAAGNHPGPVDTPARYEPVFAVGAADNAGARCGFAASGPEVDINASGCPQDVSMPDSGADAWVSGSSGATAFTAAILAQLRALRADVTPAQSEALLTDHARGSGPAAFLDVRAAFTAGGLGDALAKGDTATSKAAAIPAASATTAAALAAAASPTIAPVAKEAVTPAGLAQPRVRSWSLKRGVLRMTLANRPRGARVQVTVYARKRGRTIRTGHSRVTSSKVTLKVKGPVAEIRLRYATGLRRSPMLVLHRRH